LDDWCRTCARSLHQCSKTLRLLLPVLSLHLLAATGWAQCGASPAAPRPAFSAIRKVGNVPHAES
jgi:hypothetical protein